MALEAVEVSTTSRALKGCIRRALRNRKRARKKLKTDPIHDLRVALRRCRSLAEGLSVIDPDPAWRRLRKASKKQQSGLSDLRDVQVLTNWLKPLRLTTGPVGRALVSHLGKQERRARREARSLLKSFPRKRWKRWLRRLPERAERISVDSSRVAQLVLEQLTRVIDLHQRWMTQRSPEAWHDLRVSVKRFRYVVESFLPEKSEVWGTELQRGQDLLGEGHDLDVLHGLIVKLSRKKSLPKHAVSRSLRRVEGAAQKRRKEYASLISRPPHRNGRQPEREYAQSATEQTLWDRWRRELAAMAALNGQYGEESSKSTPKRALRVVARANRYPGRRRQISSAL